MKRTLLSTFFATGLSAATIGGSVFDPSGAAVPGAKLLLINPDTAVKIETTSAPDGKFRFDHLPGGQYILRVETPGFAPLLRSLRLGPEAEIDNGLTLQMGSIQEELRVVAKGKPAVAAAAAPKRIRAAAMCRRHGW